MDFGRPRPLALPPAGYSCIQTAGGCRRARARAWWSGSHLTTPLAATTSPSLPPLLPPHLPPSPSHRLCLSPSLAQFAEHAARASPHPPTAAAAANAGGVISVEEGVEEQEGEEEELFYESLDRILSSSGSSTSASDDDGADRPRRRRGSDASAAALDLWTSQPAPVQERRGRLLQLLGLAGDPSLARFGAGQSASDAAAGSLPASPVSRSRSGGAALGSAAKPPLGSGRLRPSLSDASDATLEAVEEDPRCLIRNLDDGSEYVVREEFCLREVGTGRQLTVEELARSPIVQELMRRQAFSTPNSNCNSNSQSGASTPIKRSSSSSSNAPGGAAAGFAASAA
ncbi:WD repeat-containing protein 44-like [Panicum miliaceum]|uniref:WD repeat-containing protein 44-like n=1 Tax=Panicum miliaceum TaxID=4540 RepID=A0A3L6QKR6_PANMI|nr:WD repeat-containing protein 44-like [Panicum miliaceum]